ncbi:complex I 24 kDa subunit family protein [Pseudobacteroides cellulosolvens]|uniref:NADH dehydrogenase (Ubiquinone) 24 kDa subunit n=1 Tax=Pseudobacteroides cellulosolvens ATCC 35603 = DSM 2933 TaxID=398512 RepID=A0A0L6JK43_9FIRM|nr:NAD(P)H-dependent oxidoreductase subunit E [Pseudobacteroides cellulosolvens]KNY25727.1 NADH dehydrogenase (ubiquinone) 24 kDa subunit [Pseudobacteroides cellulosolvens ATCC 35603 = DSM 2933]
MCKINQYSNVDEILERYQNKKSSLIAVLQEIQSEYKYLPEDVLEYVSKKMEITLSKIFSVATFYENFSLDPKGKYIIKICDGTACHVRKSIPILNALRKELGLSDKKHSTDDMLFTLETVSCLGACGLAPVITINDKVYAKMTPESAIDVINEIRKENSDEN